MKLRSILLFGALVGCLGTALAAAAGASPLSFVVGLFEPYLHDAEGERFFTESEQTIQRRQPDGTLGAPETTWGVEVETRAKPARSGQHVRLTIIVKGKTSDSLRAARLWYANDNNGNGIIGSAEARQVVDVQFQRSRGGRGGENSGGRDRNSRTLVLTGRVPITAKQVVLDTFDSKLNIATSSIELP